MKKGRIELTVILAGQEEEDHGTQSHTPSLENRARFQAVVGSGRHMSG